MKATNAQNELDCVIRDKCFTRSLAHHSNHFSVFKSSRLMQCQLYKCVYLFVFTYVYIYAFDGKFAATHALANHLLIVRLN